MSYKLTARAIELIRTNNDLAFDVAEALKITFSSLPGMLSRQTRRLTEYPVLNAIQKHTGISPENLIEEYTEDDNSKDTDTERETNIETLSEEAN
ncbi:MAG TPA: hypothetical protein PLA68_09395 [Panacibacter sp.]|nr:hypothetical protein [Panacibacter sp.]